MLKITFVVTIFFALGAIANADSSISGQKAELEREQQVVRKSIDQLKSFKEGHRVKLAEYQKQIKYFEVMVREIFYADLMPKINETDDKIRDGASEIESKTVSASVDVTECKESAQLPVDEFNSTVESMHVCLSNKLQPVDKFDDATENIYKEGVDQLENIFTDSQRYAEFESFDTAMSYMKAAGKESESAAKEIEDKLTSNIDYFVDQTWNTTFSTYDCDPSTKLQTIKLEVLNVIEKFDSCVQHKIDSTSA